MSTQASERATTGSCWNTRRLHRHHAAVRLQSQRRRPHGEIVFSDGDAVGVGDDLSAEASQVVVQIDPHLGCRLLKADVGHLRGARWAPTRRRRGQHAANTVPRRRDIDHYSRNATAPSPSSLHLQDAQLDDMVSGPSTMRTAVKCSCP